MTKMKNDVLRVDDVIKHFIFPYFLKKTVVFHKPQRLKCNVTCFPRIIFPYFFKPQRLKYNVWNPTLFVFRISFSRTFSNRNVWNATLLVFRVSFSRTFSKISRLSPKNRQRLKIQRYCLFPWTVYINVAKLFLILLTMQLTDFIMHATMIIPGPFHSFDS